MLDSDGFIVIPVLSTVELHSYRKEIINYLDNVPEFKIKNVYTTRKNFLFKERRFVSGGFGALSLSSASHVPVIRKLRLHIHEFGKNALKEMSQRSNYKFEQVPCRFMFRPKGDVPTAESWHRDESKFAKDSDIIYGGWVNLNFEGDQYFSCIPGSQIQGKHRGFAKLSREEQKDCKNKKRKIFIPPGYMLIFNETLLHEVCTIKMKFDTFRLHTAWRLTHESESLLPDLNQCILNQKAFTIKSGQSAAEYPRLAWTNWRDQLEKHSEKFKDSCKEFKTVQSGNHSGDMHFVVKQNLPSLCEINCMYIPYTEVETIIFQPT